MERKRQENKTCSQGKMESIFQPRSTFTHAWSGLNSYTNRATQYLSRGRTHSSVRANTNMWGVSE